MSIFRVRVEKNVYIRHQNIKNVMFSYHIFFNPHELFLESVISDISFKSSRGWGHVLVWSSVYCFYIRTSLFSLRSSHGSRFLSSLTQSNACGWVTLTSVFLVITSFLYVSWLSPLDGLFMHFFVQSVLAEVGCDDVSAVLFWFTQNQNTFNNSPHMHLKK